MKLDQLFPIYKVEHDLILSRQGDMTMAFDVDLPELFSLSGVGFEALHAAWSKAVGVLAGNTVLHKQDWFVDRSFRGEFAVSVSLPGELTLTTTAGCLLPSVPREVN